MCSARARQLPPTIKRNSISCQAWDWKSAPPTNSWPRALLRKTALRRPIFHRGKLWPVPRSGSGLICFPLERFERQGSHYFGELSASYQTAQCVLGAERGLFSMAGLHQTDSTSIFRPCLIRHLQEHLGHVGKAKLSRVMLSAYNWRAAISSRLMLRHSNPHWSWDHWPN